MDGHVLSACDGMKSPMENYMHGNFKTFQYNTSCMSHVLVMHLSIGNNIGNI